MLLTHYNQIKVIKQPSYDRAGKESHRRLPEGPESPWDDFVAHVASEQESEKWRELSDEVEVYTIPAENIELEINPAFPDQELITNRSTRVTYWEGAAQVSWQFSRQTCCG
jgi:hypothetical protein